MICERCHKEIEPVCYKRYDVGGEKKLEKKCPECGQNVKKYQAFYTIKKWEKETGNTWESLPLSLDERGAYKCDVDGCENATEEGTMLHHFFPKFLFGVELAERAPKARLCKTHHMDIWHKQLTPDMKGHKE